MDYMGDQFTEEIKAKQRETRAAEGQRLRAEYNKGLQFLDEQAYNTDIEVVHYPGSSYHVQYEVLRKGIGRQPQYGDRVVVRQRVYPLGNQGRTVKDSDYQILTSIIYANYEPKWLLDFKEGEMRRYTSNRLSSKGPTIPKGGGMVYELELIRILPKQTLLDSWNY